VNLRFRRNTFCPHVPLNARIPPQRPKNLRQEPPRPMQGRKPPPSQDRSANIRTSHFSPFLPLPPGSFPWRP
jgi:hypothetical protein